MDSNNNKIFVRITNKMIYDEIVNIKQISQQNGQNIKWHRRWLFGITGALFPIFIFILSLIINN